MRQDRSFRLVCVVFDAYLIVLTHQVLQLMKDGVQQR